MSILLDAAGDTIYQNRTWVRFESEDVMRSIGLSLLVCGFVAAALGLGCGGKQPETLDPREAMQGEFAGAPDWVIRGCASYWGDDASKNICGVS